MPDPSPDSVPTGGQADRDLGSELLPIAGRQGLSYGIFSRPSEVAAALPSEWDADVKRWVISLGARAEREPGFGVRLVEELIGALAQSNEVPLDLVETQLRTLFIIVDRDPELLRTAFSAIDARLDGGRQDDSRSNLRLARALLVGVPIGDVDLIVDYGICDGMVRSLRQRVESAYREAPFIEHASVVDLALEIAERGDILGIRGPRSFFPSRLLAQLMPEADYFRRLITYHLLPLGLSGDVLDQAGAVSVYGLLLLDMEPEEAAELTDSLCATVCARSTEETVAGSQLLASIREFLLLAHEQERDRDETSPRRERHHLSPGELLRERVVRCAEDLIHEGEPAKVAHGICLSSRLISRGESDFFRGFIEGPTDIGERYLSLFASAAMENPIVADAMIEGGLFRFLVQISGDSSRLRPFVYDVMAASLVNSHMARGAALFSLFEFLSSLPRVEELEDRVIGEIRRCDAAFQASVVRDVLGAYAELLQGFALVAESHGMPPLDAADHFVSRVIRECHGVEEALEELGRITIFYGKLLRKLHVAVGLPPTYIARMNEFYAELFARGNDDAR